MTLESLFSVFVRDPSWDVRRSWTSCGPHVLCFDGSRWISGWFRGAWDGPVSGRDPCFPCCGAARVWALVFVLCGFLRCVGASSMFVVVGVSEDRREL